jgi:hypothetical protein
MRSTARSCCRVIEAVSIAPTRPAVAGSRFFPAPRASRPAPRYILPRTSSTIASPIARAIAALVEIAGER